MLVISPFGLPKCEREGNALPALSLFIASFIFMQELGLFWLCPAPAAGARGRAGRAAGAAAGLQFRLAPPGVAGRSRKRRPKGGRGDSGDIRAPRSPPDTRGAHQLGTGSDMDDGGG